MNPQDSKENPAPAKRGEGKGGAAMPASRIATQARVCAQVVLTVLAETLRERRPADRTLRNLLAENRQLGSRDRRIISETLFSVLRWWGWLRKMAPDALAPAPQGESAPVLHSSDWLGLFAAAWLLDNRFDLPPSVGFWLREAGLFPDLFFGLSADTPVPERRRNLRPFFKDNSMPPMTVDELLPAWIGDELMPLPEGHGLLELTAWQQRRPPVWVRTQSKDIIQLKAVVERESEGAAKLAPHPAMKGAFAIRNASVNLRALPSFQNGAFELQDLASQCVVRIAAPQPGEQWWDVCAGGGGKSLHLGALMQNRGSILATDIRANKLEELKLRARRAHLSNLRTKVWDGRQAKEAAPRFDGVLVDAPCTCSGTWRRAPEGRWNTLPEKIPSSAALQSQLLATASGGVRPGGVLVYATCSLFRQENLGVVEEFLKTHPDFALEDFPNPMDGQPVHGTLQLWPWDGDCDAMFIAKFRRNA